MDYSWTGRTVIWHYVYIHNNSVHIQVHFKSFLIITLRALLLVLICVRESRLRPLAQIEPHSKAFVGCKCVSAWVRALSGTCLTDEGHAWWFKRAHLQKTEHERGIKFRISKAKKKKKRKLCSKSKLASLCTVFMMARKMLFIIERNNAQWIWHKDYIWWFSAYKLLWAILIH